MCNYYRVHNARPHNGAPIVARLEKYEGKGLNRPLYSSDLSPLDIDLFPKLNRFPDINIVNEEVSRRVRELNKDQVRRPKIFY